MKQYWVLKDSCGLYFEKFNGNDTVLSGQHRCYRFKSAAEARCYRTIAGEDGDSLRVVKVTPKKQYVWVLYCPAWGEYFDGEGWAWVAHAAHEYTSLRAARREAKKWRKFYTVKVLRRRKR